MSLDPSLQTHRPRWLATPDARSVRAKGDYVKIFVALLAIYAALWAGLQFFMLDTYAGDFLEQRWLASGSSPYRSVIAIFCLLVVCHFGASQRGRLSDRYVTMLAIFPILPMVAVYQHRGAFIEYLLMSISCLVLIWGFIRLKLPVIRIDSARVLTEQYLFYITVGLGLIFMAASAATGNIEYLNFDIFRVYEFRTDAQMTRAGVLEYVVTNLVTIFMPLSIALSLESKNYKNLAILAGLTVLIFGFTSHKSHLSIIFFVVFVYFVMKKFGLKGLIWSFTGIIAFGLILHFISRDLDIFGTLTIRRIFFVPAYTNYLFYDYFSLNPKYLWSDSRLTFGLVSNPYGVNMPRLIMELYSDASVEEVRRDLGTINTGFLGSGYGQAGYFGMLLYAVLIGFMLKIGDAISERVGAVPAFAAMSHYFLTVVFASSDFVTTLLTYGTLLWPILAIALNIRTSGLSAGSPPNYPSQNQRVYPLAAGASGRRN